MESQAGIWSLFSAPWLSLEMRFLFVGCLVQNPGLDRQGLQQVSLPQFAPGLCPAEGAFKVDESTTKDVDSRIKVAGSLMDEK